jgi:flagellar motor switch protein FliN
MSSPTAIEEAYPYTDVPIDIRVELDRRFIKLGDVLELLDGGVIALTKPAGEPLDIFVGNVPFGTGEVIVLNENFNVRITAFAAEDKKPLMAPFAGESNNNSRSPNNMPLQSADSGTLTLLLDQMVCVGVVVGRARLPLENLLKLTTGSVLELESTVKKPVEVFVNDQVLASGEVVVVDGNYGVRIQSVNRGSRLAQAGRLDSPATIQ